MYEISPESLAATIRSAQIVARLLRSKLNPDGMNVRQNNGAAAGQDVFQDRKSTRLNSSHANISYAVFCLKKKKSAVANPLATRTASMLSSSGYTRRRRFLRPSTSSLCGPGAYSPLTRHRRE